MSNNDSYTENIKKKTLRKNVSKIIGNVAHYSHVFKELHKRYDLVRMLKKESIPFLSMFVVI